MELLIGGSVLALGYAMSKGTSRKKLVDGPRDISVGVPGAYPFPDTPADSGVLLARQERLAQERWDAARDPRASGIVDRNAPFFSSYAKQSTNDEVKQRRMELYTGVATLEGSKTGVWQPKTESGARFAPASQPVTSGGSSGNASNYETQRLTSAISAVQSNTLPFQQVRVGPGIGVGAGTVATDGFHSQYRVMPVDAWAYKQNILPGRINPGSSTVTAREVDPKHYSKGVSRFYDMERRPLEKGRAAATGQAIRPQTGVKGCHYDSTHEYFGVAGTKGQNVQAGAWDRSKNDEGRQLPLTNVTGARAGMGAFTGGVYDSARFESQQRESDQGTGGAGFKGDQRRHQAPSSFLMQATKRDLAKYQDYNGILGHHVPTGAVAPRDVPQPTLREQLHDQGNGYAAAGPATVTGPTVQCTDRQLLKQAKRGTYSTNTYVTPPERTEAFRRTHGGMDDVLVRRSVGEVRVRVDANPGQRQSHGAASRMYMNQAGSGVSTAANNKLETENRFQDYGIAQTVLKDNDLHVPIV